jgi:hypothetical protein
MVTELSPLPSGLSALYQLFSAPRRCYVIQAVRAADTERLAVREVARAVAAAETTGCSRGVTNGQYRNVYNALTQTHLSKLAAEEIIEYETNRKVIAGGTNLRTAHRLLVLTRSMYRIQDLNHRATRWRSNSNE